MEKIKDWFGVMATTSSSRLCELPPRSVETKITDVIRDFRQFEIDNESLGESGANKDHPEYPYFDPHSLYIQVAYMVYFYTNSREIARPPSTSVGLGKIKNCEDYLKVTPGEKKTPIQKRLPVLVILGAMMVLPKKHFSRSLQRKLGSKQLKLVKIKNCEDFLKVTPGEKKTPLWKRPAKISQL